ncbi:MAG: response regulator [Phycisphaerae bacterium]
MMNTMPMGRGIKILIADDPADWMQSFIEDLHKSSVDAFLAASEQQGFEIIRREHVDLAVIAGDNPRVGGLELVRRVHWYSAEVPVIVLGGEMNLRWLQDALRIGVRTILPRPVNAGRLLDTCVKILGV